ncbi:retrovirus-related pol polyprotein from transposon 17.6 [Tanacetum coccineum]
MFLYHTISPLMLLGLGDCQYGRVCRVGVEWGKVRGLAVSVLGRWFGCETVGKGGLGFGGKWGRFVKAHGETVGWDVYEEGILKRFGVVNEDPMAELKNLRHTTNMKEYQGQFEQLLTQVDITESQAASLAMIKQKATPVLPTLKFNNNYYVSRNVAYPNKATIVTTPVLNTQVVTKYPALPSPAPRKMLSQKEFTEKRAKNQCFYCDKKYVSGHKCEGHVFTLEIRRTRIEECLEEEEEEESDMISYELIDPTPQTSPHISLNALSGIPTYNTMRLKGHVLKKILHILMDSGSTHNFLDFDMVKAFQWKIQGVLFEADVMLLPLGGCEMVLGVQGLATLGTIQWNFKDLIMQFYHERQKFLLRGTHQSELAWLTGKQMSKLVAQSELPLQRSFDHKIPFKEDNVAVNIRPYRYPPNQKDTIETMVKELLDSGVIRPSNSPFSSPIVMVKKKDGTWRMCIDYRQLNKHAIKDKFPIPVIEELIDELQGAQPLHVCHIDHLRMVLQVMRENTLFAKKFKCVFGTTQVEYLGHVISAKWVSTDLSKIKAMQEWHVPSTLKQLRGFLGLTGYYRRFIQGYVAISQPLTLLLKKMLFSGVQKLKKPLKDYKMRSPVLAPLNFDEEFIIETDASGFGIGAVLHQNKHLIAYLSKTLAPKHQSLSTYEKELLVVVLALQNWRGYLLDRHFKIRTDHFSLKYVLDQRLTTPFQSKWLPKLLGFDYEIEYKNGTDNTAVDALSRVERQGAIFSLLAGVSNELMDAVIATWSTYPSLQAVIKGLQNKTLVNSKSAGYYQKAYYLFLLEMFEKNGQGMGLLQPLPIPDKIWQDLSMDFIESLPMSQGKSALLVVDRLSKCMTGETPKDWVKWIPLAEYWYNTNYHSALDTTPYEVVYGQTPPMHIPYMAKDSLVEVVDRTLQAREQVVQLLKFNIKRAQDRMKSQADKRRFDRIFQVNDCLYLKLQPYRQITVRQGGQHKLSSKFFGPFQVLEKIGKVAYKLKLPDYAKVHPVFHVSQLKPCYIDSAVMGSFPSCDSEGLLSVTPFKLLDRRMVKQNNRMVVFRLIQWSNRSEEDATWEKLEDLLARFPEFSLDP